mmetsp:Transcript_102695/g.306748  ORF Transcript_102695/g.306748 Transcript_102695/m.306748 type:complete len:219 (+) Transcript_102695:1595-2251(+)
MVLRSWGAACRALRHRSEVPGGAVRGPFGGSAWRRTPLSIDVSWVRAAAEALQLLDLQPLGLAQLPEVLDLLLAELQEPGHELKLLVLGRHHQRRLLVLGLQDRRHVLGVRRRVCLHHVEARLDVGHLRLLVLQGQIMLVLLDAEELLVAHGSVPRGAAIPRLRDLADGRGSKLRHSGSRRCREVGSREQLRRWAHAHWTHQTPGGAPLALGLVRALS